MSTAAPVDTDLHLPDLRIKGFRGVKDLHISRPRTGDYCWLERTDIRWQDDCSRSGQGIRSTRSLHRPRQRALESRRDCACVRPRMDQGLGIDPVPRWENLRNSTEGSLGPERSRSLSVRRKETRSAFNRSSGRSGRIPTSSPMSTAPGELVPIRVRLPGTL